MSMGFICRSLRGRKFSPFSFSFFCYFCLWFWIFEFLELGYLCGFVRFEIIY